MWSPLLSWLNFNQWIQAEEKGNFNSLHSWKSKGTKALLPWGEGVAFGKGVPLHPHDSWHRNFHQLSEKPQVTTTTEMPSVTPAQVGVYFCPFFLKVKTQKRAPMVWDDGLAWFGDVGAESSPFLIKQREFKQRIKNTNFERQRCRKNNSYCWWFRNLAITSWGKGFITLFPVFQHHPRGLFAISEPSTVAFGQKVNAMNKSPKPHTWRGAAGATGVDLCGFF